MRILDATFIIDYLAGHEKAKSYYDQHDGSGQQWITPVLAYAEVLVGVGNVSGADVARTITAIS